MQVGDTFKRSAAFTAQLLLESGIAGSATLGGMAAGAAASNLLNPSHGRPGALATCAFAVIILGPPVLAGVFLDRRVRFFNGRTLDARAGVWVAAVGALLYGGAQLAASVIENASGPPASADAGVFLTYMAATDTWYMFLGLFAFFPAFGMMVYGATKLILRVLYRNRPNQPPRARITKPPAIQRLHLDSRE